MAENVEEMSKNLEESTASENAPTTENDKKPEEARDESPESQEKIKADEDGASNSAQPPLENPAVESLQNEEISQENVEKILSECSQTQNPSNIEVPSASLDQSEAVLDEDIGEKEVPDLAATVQDQELIFERLAKIRDHKRQVLDMLDQLKENEGEEQMDKIMVAKLIGAYDNFKAQEDEYLRLLQKIMALRKTAGGENEAQNEMSNLTTALELLQGTILILEYKFKFRHVIYGWPQGSENAARGGNLNLPAVGPPKEQQDNGLPEPGPEAAGDDVDDGWAQLEALKKQRDLLKKMLTQQTQMKALKELQGTAVAKQQETVQRELKDEKDMTSSRIAQEAAEIEAKRRELNELKRLVETMSALPSKNGTDAENLQDLPHEKHAAETSDKPPAVAVVHPTTSGKAGGSTEFEGPEETVMEEPESESAPDDEEATAALLQEKLGKLRENRAKMDQIMGELGNLQQRIEATTTSAGGIEGRLQAGGQARVAALQRVLPDPQNEDDLTEEDLENAIGGVKDQLKDLAAVKERLFALQRMTEVFHQHEEQEFGEEIEGEDGAPDPLERREKEPVDPEKPESDMGDMYFEDNVRSEYENRLQEQEQALQELQTERNRLLGIKNQLLKLHQDYAMNENTNQQHLAEGAAGGPEFLGGQEAVVEPERQRSLNNSRSGGWQRQLPPTAGETVSTTATWGSVSPHAERLQQQYSNNDLQIGAPSTRSATTEEFRERSTVSQSPAPPLLNSEIPQENRRRPGDSSTIINNPRLASFRRNNQLETCSNASASHVQFHAESNPTGAYTNLNLNERRTSEASIVAEQYSLLQEHIDSIRSIFRNMSSAVGGESDGSTNQGPPSHSAANQTQAPSPMWPPPYQMLLSNVLACQQQLQMQQMEVNQLRNFCQELAQSQLVPVPGAPSPLQGQNLNQSENNLANFDGRPLSSRSLYNLLAPNPYLTYPYYPHQGQFGTWPRQQMPQSPVTRHPWAPQPPTLSQSWHPGLQQQGSKSNLAASYNRGRIESSDESPRQEMTEVKNLPPSAGVGAGKPPPVPRLDFRKQSNVQRRASAFAHLAQQEKNVRRRSMGTRSTPARGPHEGSVNTSQEYLAGGSAPEYSLKEESENYNRGSTGFLSGEQFDSLREVIYSEVATLISQNEQRPQFLLELFRELQLLGSDYLRTRAVQSIRDLLSRYLTETEGDESALETQEEPARDGADSEGVFIHAQERNAKRTRAPVEVFSGKNSAMMEYGGPYEQRQNRVFERSVDLGGRRVRGQEFSEVVPSTSSLSSPEKSGVSGYGSNGNGLGETMIRSDPKAVSGPWKRFENLEDIKNVKAGQERLLDLGLNNKNPTTGKQKPHTARPQQIQRIQNSPWERETSRKRPQAESAPTSSRIDIVGLERQIEVIVDELVPFLKENSDSECTPQLLEYLRKLVLTLTLTKCVREEAMSEFFHRQLSTILEDTVAKYTGQKLEMCGEELLTDISEAVFNELAFFRLMQNIDSFGTGPDQQRRKSLATDSSASERFRDRTSPPSSGTEELSSPFLENKLNNGGAAAACTSAFRDPHRQSPTKQTTTTALLGFAVSELNGDSAIEEDPEISVKEAEQLSASLRSDSAFLSKFPPLKAKARDPEENTAVARQLAQDVDVVLAAKDDSGAEGESVSLSMHTAPNKMVQKVEAEGIENGSVADSRGTTPPEEIPEQLEQDGDSSESSSYQPDYPKAFTLIAATTKNVQADPVTVGRVNSDPTQFNLNFEPHPVDHENGDNENSPITDQQDGTVSTEQVEVVVNGSAAASLDGKK